MGEIGFKSADIRSGYHSTNGPGFQRKVRVSEPPKRKRRKGKMKNFSRRVFAFLPAALRQAWSVGGFETTHAVGRFGCR
jgi:hypothetical protein